MCISEPIWPWRQASALDLLKALVQTGRSEWEIDRFVVPQRTRRQRAQQQPLVVAQTETGAQS
jgi:hypothetical protein